ncbi:alpha/beta hydrolase [Bacillus tianshenii]|uniref:alpha/beta fold hydrolase n=1 Tax=Sutcliffiella tianshenii TaxID=1463404 RepID=UPI001CD25357|nr:alpha/beta hydrolase [Bacillus tianshenii]MCA1320984.1 alpha/beta hydrolase [Bacillus tianshenii]
MLATEREHLVPIGESFLYTKLYGERTYNPTVIMDAGYGDYSKAWDTIIPEISKSTQVLVYDRAGLGKSTKINNPRTSLHMVGELKELLAKLDIKPPYILVGHSFGGVNIRIFAEHFPEEVAGMVLVDSTPEDYRERFLPTMSEEFQSAYNQQFIHEGNYDEFIESLNQIKDCTRKLEIPVMVLAAGKKAHYSKESQELWNAMQRELVDISTNGELVMAENSAHYIQNDAPDVVIRAIKRLLGGL